MRHIRFCTSALLMAASLGASAAPDTKPVPVSADNFVRAESDLYFTHAMEDKGIGKLVLHRELMPIDRQTVVRANRDTLYAAAVLDLDASPATITLPDAGKRFFSMQIISEDHYTPLVTYKAGSYSITREKVGTRYALVGIRILVDPNSPEDIKKVHALQDAIKISQKASGKFEIPNWDPVSQKKVRDALVVLANTLPDTNHMFGAKGQVDPVRRVVGAASAWGGNPQKDATYLNVVPEKNDGSTVHKLVVGKVPVDGFWSVSVYNEKGYYEANPYKSYTVNSLTGKKGSDGKVTVQFGGCDGKTANCIPVTKGWNYMVRLYRPQAEILSGKWKFPVAQPVK